MRRRALAPISIGVLAWLVRVDPAAAGTTDDVRQSDLGMAALLVALAGWLVFAVAWDRWGRERTTRDDRDIPEAVELPDDPPTVVYVLRRGGSPTPGVVGMTVLDLARQGHLDVAAERPPEGPGYGLPFSSPSATPAVSPEGPAARAPSASGNRGGDVQWRVYRRQTPRGDLRPYENAVYTRLFSSADATSEDDLVEWIRSNRQQARVFLDRVQRSVSAELARRGYVERGRRLPVVVNLGTVGVVVLMGVAALAAGSWWGLAAVASGLGQGALSGRLRRRSVVGTDRSSEWGGVARALAHIDEVGGVASSDIETWEQYLIYAVALGVGREFLDALDRVDEHPADDPEFALWFHDESGNGRFDSIVDYPERLGRRLADAVDAVRSAAPGLARSDDTQRTDQFVPPDSAAPGVSVPRPSWDPGADE